MGSLTKYILLTTRTTQYITIHVGLTTLVVKYVYHFTKMLALKNIFLIKFQVNSLASFLQTGKFFLFLLIGASFMIAAH